MNNCKYCNLILAVTLIFIFSFNSTLNASGVRKIWGSKLGFFLPLNKNAYGRWVKNRSSSISDDNLSLRLTAFQGLQWKSGFQIYFSEGFQFTFFSGYPDFTQFILPLQISFRYSMPVKNSNTKFYFFGGPSFLITYTHLDRGDTSWEKMGFVRSFHIGWGFELFSNSDIPLILELEYDNYKLPYKPPNKFGSIPDDAKNANGFLFNIGLIF